MYLVARRLCGEVEYLIDDWQEDRGRSMGRVCENLGRESRSSNMYVRISWNVVKVAERAVDVSQRCMRVGDAPHGNRLAILLSDHNR